MNSTSVLLSLIALMPALALCFYIYMKDKVEREPLPLLILLFLAGGVAYLPAYYGESLIEKMFHGIFADFMSLNLASGQISWSSDVAEYSYYALCAVFAFALMEELCRWLVLYFITHKNKEFNCLFDGIVYSVFVSMGFALAVNLRYAFVDGWDTFILRLLDNVPGQLFFGVLMGYFYTLWHVHSLADDAEERLIAEGKISGEKIRYPFSKLWLSIVIPMAAHAAYSFMRLCDSEIITVIYYIIVGAIFIVCFIGIARFAKKDTSDSSIVNAIIRKHHPEYEGAELVDDEYLGLDDVEEDENTDSSEGKGE